MSMNATTLPPVDRYPNVPGPTPKRLGDVPGWLTSTDNMLFTFVLSRQNRVQEPGDLLELGVFEGRTAIHIGSYRKLGEQMTVCDLFDFARAEESIRPGARKAYANLTQETFERNFLAFHQELPMIVRGLSETIAGHVAPGSCRFIHIDASHMYEHVRGDMLNARSLLRPDGVVVFDDFRTEHCPGTAAAVWEAMAVEGLRVICVSPNKFYGTWGDPKAIQDDLIEHVATLSDLRCDIQQVMGQRLVRLAKIAPSTAAGKPAGGGQADLLAQSQQVLATAQRVLHEAGSKSNPPKSITSRSNTSRGPAWRRATIAILPPVITGAIRQRRAASR
jgi:methyltransferase family protein